MAVTPGERFRELLARPRATVIAGVWDGFSARIAERAGLEMVYQVGNATAVTRLAVPDIGLMGLETTVEAARSVARGTSLPFGVDADTGYGNAVSVVHTVREIERIGAAAVTIEDQVWPKRCGHMQGKAVITLDEMVGKMRAAVDARRDPGMVLVFRTDAIATHGIDEAVRRVQACVEVGADLVVADAVQSKEQIAALVAATDRPVMVSAVERSVTPPLTREEAEALGVRAVIYPGTGIGAVAFALTRAFEHLARYGNTRGIEEMTITMQPYFDIMDLSAWNDMEHRYVPRPATRSTPEPDEEALA
jgi:2-methylisocitrate lyase-like PEP mutase family enzyme